MGIWKMVSRKLLCPWWYFHWPRLDIQIFHIYTVYSRNGSPSRRHPPPRPASSSSTVAHRPSYTTKMIMHFHRDLQLNSVVLHVEIARIVSFRRYLYPSRPSPTHLQIYTQYDMENDPCSRSKIRPLHTHLISCTLHRSHKLYIYTYEESVGRSFVGGCRPSGKLRSAWKRTDRERERPLNNAKT